MQLHGSTKDFLDLFVITTRAPTAKLAADVQKYSTFRSALRKGLKDHVDKETAVNKTYAPKFKEVENLALDLNRELGLLKAKKDQTPEDSVKTDSLEAQLFGLNIQMGVLRTELRKEINALMEGVENLQKEIIFNVEDVAFIERLLTENASGFFSYKSEGSETEQFDDVTYSRMISLLKQENKIPNEG